MAKMQGRLLPNNRAAFSMLATALVVPFSAASPATSLSAMKQSASPPRADSFLLFTPDHPILVSVTITAPCLRASIPFCTACSENTRFPAYSKSAVVWMARLMTGSCSGLSRTPIDLSSWSISSKLRRSISDGSTCSNCIFNILSRLLIWHPKAPAAGALRFFGSVQVHCRHCLKSSLSASYNPIIL